MADQDDTLIRAMETTLDRVAYYIEQDDQTMADVAGGVVAVLLRAPGAVMLATDLRWRRALTRWSQLKRRIGAPPAALADFVLDRARIFLLEAADAAGSTR